MRPVANEEIVRGATPTIKINPNPVEGNLHLEISGLNTPASRLKYTIASSGSRILQSGPVTDDSMDIAADGLPSGLHFFSITDEYRLLAVWRLFKR